MTYKEYSKLISEHNGLISRKRSLEMTIKMNEVWLVSCTSIRGKKRLAKIEAAKKELSSLVIPPKPKQPIGYEVLDREGTFVGFFATDDIEAVKQYLIEKYGHDNFKYVSKPRFRDLLLGEL